MPRPVSIAVAMITALLAACTGAKAPADAKPAADSTTHDMAGMDMSHDAHAPKIPAGADYTAGDVLFMQGMIAHHAQAVRMAVMAPTHGAGTRVARLCKKIDLAQRDEIKLMQVWLKDRGQNVPTMDDPHPMFMTGMLTPEQMAQLDKSRNTEFDRNFLTFMIQHHNGAIKMVADLFADAPSGQSSDMFGYASGIDADQRGEISLMQELLESLPAPTPR